MIISDGIHRLPPITTLSIGVSGGRGICGANFILWTSVSLTNNGVLVLSSTGWPAWDNSYLLYERADTTERKWPGLFTVPSFTANITASFTMSDFTSLLLSSPYSYVNIVGLRNSWLGGIIRGMSVVSVYTSIKVGGIFKSLQDVVQLYIGSKATMTVTGANISMSNGAKVVIDGTLQFTNATASNPVYIGQAQLLGIPDTFINQNPEFVSLLNIYPSINWNGYFDHSVPQEESSGWYPNPECQTSCLTQPNIYVRKRAKVICDSNSTVVFVAPINFVDSTTLTVGENAYTGLASGGQCGNGVIIFIGSGTTVEMSGGNFLMSKTCTITGKGELLSTAGEHTLAQSIQAHITIQGGNLIWPLENGEHATITFYGGLLMSNTGALELQPWSTSILVYKTVQFQDQCLVTFPVIGISAQPFTSDSEAPDKSPRGSLTAVDSMVFLGGTLQGKADFIGSTLMTLDGGDKFIRNLAKLVNNGLVNWGTGNLIMENNADFLNNGKIIMANGSTFDASNYYLGTVVPQNNGGDLFALDYHSYDLDEGNLNSLGEKINFTTFSDLHEDRITVYY